MLTEWLSQEPRLTHPDFTKKFTLQTNASEVALGTVLSQSIDVEVHPSVHLSRKLFP